MRALLFFIQQLAAYKRELIIGLLLSITLAASSVALLTLSGWFISAAAFSGLSATTAILFNYFIPAAMIRFLSFIRILSRYGDRVVNHDFTFRILSTLRVWFYEKLIPLAPAHLLSHRSGDLLNRVVNDIDALDHLYLNILSPTMISLFLLTGTAIFTAYFSMLLAILFFSIASIALIITAMITYQQSQKIGLFVQEKTAQLRTKIIDSLQGMTDLLLFVKRESRLCAIDESHQQLMTTQKKFALIKGMTLSLMQLFSGITIACTLIMGIPLVRHHLITGAELAMIILLIIAVFDQLTALPFAWLSLGKTKHAAHRLLEIANTKPVIVFSEKFSAIGNHHSVVFSDVSFSYPNRPIPVIDNFSLDISSGTRLGITGDSGSGKTTLLQLIARIWDPDFGKITVDGVNLKYFSESDLRKTIALVTQHVHIFNASVRDNLTLMQETITDDVLFSVLEKMALSDLINNLPNQYNTEMGEFGKNFSGGQIRRIAIARALLVNSPVLLLDEPSTGLEHSLMQKIWRNCESDFKDKTVIVATHDQALLSMMDRVIKI